MKFDITVKLENKCDKKRNKQNNNNSKTVSVQFDPEIDINEYRNI